MQMKRIILALTLALSLSACGVGGTDDTATVTPPATAERATAVVDEPTAEPTTDTGGSNPGNTAAGEIPAPPQSSPYVQGEDPIVDGAVAAMEQSFEQQNAAGGMALSKFNYYVSSASVDDITTFYDDEMPTYGWQSGQTQDQEFGKIQVFLGPDMQTVAMIGVLDMASVEGADAAGLSGLIIFTGTGTMGGGGTGTLPGTDTGGTDTGGTLPSGSLDVPPPPGGSEIVEGEDAMMDILVSSMGPALTSAAGQQGGTITDPIFYKTDTSLQDVVDFYKKELTSEGLSMVPGTGDMTAGSGSVVFLDSSSKIGLMIMMFDGSTMGTTTGNMVVISELHM